MIKNVFFDFNGTLLDDVDLCLKIEQNLMVKEGLRPYSKREYLDHFKFPVSEYYKSVGFETNKYKDLAYYFNNEYNTRWESETKLFPEVKESLGKLKSKGYKLYCLSASPYDFLVFQLKTLGILDYFDDVCGAQNSLAYGKIEYGKEFIKSHNINSSDTIMIGDTVHDYEVSKAFLFKCILFSQGHNSRFRLEELNANIADNYLELIKEICDFNETKQS